MKWLRKTHFWKKNTNLSENLISLDKGYSDASKMDRELTLSCELCQKKSKNHKFLFGYGNKNPKLFIIIDSPSKFDLIKNKLISGSQGKILKKALIIKN